MQSDTTSNEASIVEVMTPLVLRNVCIKSGSQHRPEAAVRFVHSMVGGEHENTAPMTREQV
jgi:hypothetical protein